MSSRFKVSRKKPKKLLHEELHKVAVSRSESSLTKGGPKLQIELNNCGLTYSC